MKLKPFNLERALAGDKAVTRDGREVSEIYYFRTTRNGDPVTAVIEGERYNFFISGEYYDDDQNELDLFMEVKTKTYYFLRTLLANSRGTMGTSNLYLSKEQLLHNITRDDRTWVLHEIEIEE